MSANRRSPLTSLYRPTREDDLVHGMSDDDPTFRESTPPGWWPEAVRHPRRRDRCDRRPRFRQHPLSGYRRGEWGSGFHPSVLLRLAGIAADRELPARQRTRLPAGAELLCGHARTPGIGCSSWLGRSSPPVTPGMNWQAQIEYWRAAFTRPHLRESLIRDQDRWRAFFTETIEAGIDAGVFTTDRDPALIAMQLNCLADGTVFPAFAGNPAFDAQKLSWGGRPCADLALLLRGQERAPRPVALADVSECFLPGSAGSCRTLIAIMTMAMVPPYQMMSCSPFHSSARRQERHESSTTMTLTICDFSSSRTGDPHPRAASTFGSMKSSYMPKPTT